MGTTQPAGGRLALPTPGGEALPGGGQGRAEDSHANHRGLNVDRAVARGLWRVLRHGLQSGPGRDRVRR